MKRDLESSGDRESGESGERYPRGWETKMQRKLEKESRRRHKRAENWGKNMTENRRQRRQVKGTRRDAR